MEKTKKTKNKFENIDAKRILIIAIPIVLAILAIVVILKQKSNEETNQILTNNAFIPDSEESKSVASKLDAYNAEDEERRQKVREENASVVKNSDFFNQVTGDAETKTNNSKIKDNEDLQSFYERTVLNEPEKKTNYKSNNTESPIKKKAFIPEDDDSEDQIEEMYRQTKKRNVEVVHESSKKPKNKIQSLIKKESVALEWDEDKEVNNPDNYKRTRSRSSKKGIDSNLVKACIHGDQEITSGARVRMRLIEEMILVDGNLIPKNTLFYGIAQIQNDRLNVLVSSIKYQDYIIKVDFVIYDNDAIKGLNLSDNIKQELARKGKESAIDQVSIPSSAVGGGIIGSAVNSTVNGAKQVFRKAEGQIKVPLKANYQLFIKEI